MTEKVDAFLSAYGTDAEERSDLALAWIYTQGDSPNGESC